MPCRRLRTVILWICLWWTDWGVRVWFIRAEDNNSLSDDSSFRVMNAASDASSAKSLPFHSLPLMLALSLFINSSTTTPPSMVAAADSPTAAPDAVSSPELSANGKNFSVTGILDALLKGYDKRVRPKYGADPVEVDVTMHISSISSMSEVDMDFTIDLYFRQYWTDPRLMIDVFPTKANQITVGQEMMDKIWMPDTFFPNEKKSAFHTTTVINKFLRIRANGSLYTSIRLTNTLNCELDLSFFPLDYQNCSVEIESYGYDTSDIHYFWRRNFSAFDQVEYNPKKLILPQFKILSAIPHQRLIATGTGFYSRLSCELKFSRRLGYYLIQIYIPSSLIVVISWVSFWLSRESTPARVSLGVTTVLTMTTLMSSTNSQLPKVSYAKGIDVYLGTCFVMVFASLLEYAAVGYSSKRLKMRAAKTGHPMPPPPTRHNPSIGGSGSHTAGSPSKAMQQVLGSNHSLHHPEHQPLTMACRNTVSSPGLEGSNERFGERDHGSLHGRRSVEFRYKSWGSDHSHNHLTNQTSSDFHPAINPGNGPVTQDMEAAMSRSYSLPRVAPKKKREFRASEIDKYSRFNLTYWFTYLSISVVPGGMDPPRPDKDAT